MTAGSSPAYLHYFLVEEHCIIVLHFRYSDVLIAFFITSHTFEYFDRLLLLTFEYVDHLLLLPHAPSNILIAFLFSLILSSNIFRLLLLPHNPQIPSNILRLSFDASETIEFFDRFPFECWLPSWVASHTFKYFNHLILLPPRLSNIFIAFLCCLTHTWILWSPTFVVPQTYLPPRSLESFGSYYLMASQILESVIGVS